MKFSITPIVAVRIDSEHKDGLVGRFLQWQMDTNTFPLLPGGFTGQGKYVGYFDPDDAAKIRQWFVSQNAVEAVESDETEPK